MTKNIINLNSGSMVKNLVPVLEHEGKRRLKGSNLHTYTLGWWVRRARFLAWAR
jgi:hypothetical protein